MNTTVLCTGCDKKMAKTVCIFPQVHKMNKFVSLILDALRMSGYTIHESKIRLSDYDKIDAFLFNWYEALPERNYLPIFLKKLLRLVYLKLLGKDLYWVLHNRKPHNAHKFSVILMKILFHLTKRTVILCDESVTALRDLGIAEDAVNNKIFKIPHPNYIGSYPEYVEVGESTRSVIRFLFVGLIRPYKNIELLIEAFSRLDTEVPVELLIAGSVSSDSYSSKIMSLVEKDTRIKTDFRFIPDDELSTLLQQHDILVLPYNKQSSLNSGTILLAFSYSRTVVSPLIGTLKEYADGDFYYGYDYNLDEDHLTALTKILGQVVHDFKINPEKIKSMGKQAFQAVESNNSLAVVASRYAELIGT